MGHRKVESSLELKSSPELVSPYIKLHCKNTFRLLLVYLCKEEMMETSSYLPLA